MRRSPLSTYTHAAAALALTALSCCGAAGGPAVNGPALELPERTAEAPAKPEGAKPVLQTCAKRGDAGVADTLAVPGSVSSVDPSGPEVDPRVQNGTVYDKATVDASAFDTVVIPQDATLVRGGTGCTVQLYTAKNLGFLGHPSERMDLAEARSTMGCGTRADGKTLLVDTWGSWSTKEGGAEIVLLVVAPDAVDVEQRKNPSGVVEDGEGTPRALPKGWTVVPSTPDGARHASKALP